MALVWRVLITALAAFVGVCAAYFVAGGRGWWFAIFVVGLIAGRATRGGWLAGMAGVIGGHLLMGSLNAPILSGYRRDATDFAFYGGLYGIVLFTPAYLFGAAARMRKQPTIGQAATDRARAAPKALSSGLSPGAMVGLGCAILGVSALVFGFFAYLLGARGY